MGTGHTWVFRSRGRLFGLARTLTWGAALAGALALLSPSLPARADSTPALELKIKAGYVFNFAKFVEWPSNAFSSADSPFIIAVLDGHEFQPLFEQMMAGKNVNGHPVQVKTASKTSLPTDAHILLVTRSADQTPEEIRKVLGNAPTLVVGETDQFAERGGAIGFVRDEESIRLTLCLEHATEKGLRVSAKLSNVAKSVKSKRQK